MEMVSRRRSSGLLKRLPSDCCRRYGGVDERSGVLVPYPFCVFVISNALQLNALIFFRDSGMLGEGAG